MSESPTEPNEDNIGIEETPPDRQDQAIATERKEELDAPPKPAPLSSLPTPQTSIALSDPVLAGYIRFAACAFDSEWYLVQYPDVRNAGVDPTDHFFQTGWREWRWPNRFFDPIAYISANPDLGTYNGNPFWHYITHGARENRPLR